MTDQPAAPVPPRKRPGVPKGQKAMRWKPTEFQRGQIYYAAAMGQPQEDIAAEFGVDDKTLRKHCRAELDHARPHLLRKLIGSLADQALGRPAQYDKRGKLLRDELKPVPTPGIFLVKILGKKYGLTERIDLGGADDGQPVRFVIEGFGTPALPAPGKQD